METNLAELAQQQSFRIEESSGIGVARRYATRLADALGFDETTAGELAIVVTEAATNMLRHAGGGELLLRPLFAGPGGGSGVELLALDKGAGISDLAHSMRDGVSTAGTAGSGLGAMRRLATEFEVYSAADRGSAFYLTVWNRADAAVAAAPAALQIGVVSLPKAGEHACGDGWAALDGNRAVLAVADGLGHGPDAANAARAVLDVLRDRAELAPAQLIALAHQRARPTRGAAVAFATWQNDPVSLRFAGVGNIAASVQSGIERRQQLISHNGIVGHNLRKVQELTPTFDPAQALLIMHSDGLSAQWDLEAYPGLATRHPALIAAVLYRDFNRGTDDVTVLVARAAKRQPPQN